MPSVTQSPAFSSSKKRRRDDGDGDGDEAQVSLYGPPKQHHHYYNNLLLQACRVPPADGVSYTSSPQYHHHHHHHGSQNPFSALGSNNERLFFSSSCSSPSTSNNHRDLGSSHHPPVFNLPRKVIPLPASKRFRALDPDHERQDRQQENQEDDDGGLTSPSGGQPHHFSHAHPEYSTTPPISPQIQPYHHHQARGASSNVAIKPSAALLDPCHICHRKPTKKSDVDSFADCMGCGQRTCFVCIRQCQGWLGSVGGGDFAGEGWRPTSSTITAAAAAAAAEEQQQQDLSASFTMEDVDDDMDHHHQHEEAHSADRRPLKSHHLQNKGGGSHGNGVHGGGARGGPEEGWSGRGHRDVVCSRCCVEKGSEGDVVCLGCLAGIEGA